MKWPIHSLSKIATDLQPGFARLPKGGHSSFPQLRTNNVSPDGRIDLTLVKEVPASRKECERYSLQDGDILFNNTNSVDLVGKTAFFDLDGGPYLFSNHMTRVRVNHDIADPHFVARQLFWIWKSGGFRTMITRWVNQAAINKTMLGGIAICLPALSEQYRIVEILDQADALHKERIEVDAKATRILPALFCKMFGDPATNPKGWPTDRLDNLFDVVGGGTPSKSIPEYWTGNIPWVSPKDMKGDIVLDTEDHITQEAIYNSATRLVKKGSILVVYRSGILAHSFPVAFAGRDLTINQDLKALSSKGEVTNEYLYGLLSAIPAVGLSCVKKGATVHNVDGSRFLSLKIFKPPEELQKVFASHLHMLLKNKAKRQVASEKLDCLFAVLLHRAFTGDLTAKWREGHMEELLREMEEQARKLEAHK